MQHICEREYCMQQLVYVRARESTARSKLLSLRGLIDPTVSCPLLPVVVLQNSWLFAAIAAARLPSV
jgi:hypothetical protein